MSLSFTGTKTPGRGNVGIKRKLSNKKSFKVSRDCRWKVKYFDLGRRDIIWSSFIPRKVWNEKEKSLLYHEQFSLLMVESYLVSNRHLGWKKWTRSGKSDKQTEWMGTGIYQLRPCFPDRAHCYKPWRWLHDDQTRKLGIIELHMLNHKNWFSLSEIKRKCLRQKLLFIFILEKWVTLRGISFQ